jgi:hypothetical protein
LNQAQANKGIDFLHITLPILFLSFVQETNTCVPGEAGVRQQEA